MTLGWKCTRNRIFLGRNDSTSAGAVCAERRSCTQSSWMSLSVFHEIPEWFGLQGTLKTISFHLPRVQVSPSPIQCGLQHFQGCLRGTIPSIINFWSALRWSSCWIWWWWQVPSSWNVPVPSCRGSEMLSALFWAEPRSTFRPSRAKVTPEWWKSPQHPDPCIPLLLWALQLEQSQNEGLLPVIAAWKHIINSDRLRWGL